MIKQFKIIWKKYFKVLLSNIIVISLGVALLFGLMNGLTSVHLSMDKFLSDNHYPDIRIITNIEDQDIIKEIEQEKYKSIDSRLSISTILKKEKQIISVKASTYTDQNNNDFYVWKKQKNASGYYDISVEKKFADNNNINLGDTLSLKIGEDYYKFFVSRIISIPEAMVSVPINGLWGTIRDYGNVYIHKDVLEKETYKLKQKYYKELNEKEEELKKEEITKLEEYYSQKGTLQKAVLEYNSEKAYYEKIKEQLNNKNTELQNKKEQLLEIRDDYLDIMNKIDTCNNLIDTYIDSYNSLSEEAKKYIENQLKEKYPEISIEEIEFLSDILFYTINGKLNEVFDPNTEINQQIIQKVMMADMIKGLIDYQYGFYQSDEVTKVIEQIKNNEEIEDQFTYEMIIYNLSLVYSNIEEITKENVVNYYEITNIVLEEIHQLEQKISYNSFQDLYNTLEGLKDLIPFLYDMVKEQYKPYIKEILEKNKELKEDCLNKVEEIYQCSICLSDKTRIIKNIIIDYVKQIIDDSIKEKLKEYTEDIDKTPIEIVDYLLNLLYNGSSEIYNNITEIDNGLNKTYQTIEEKRTLLEEAYNLFMISIEEAKEELKAKRKKINDYKGYESKINEILIQVKENDDKEKLLGNAKEELKDIRIIDSYTIDNSPVKDSMNYNIVGLERVATIIPTIFYTIILIILFLFISLMIKQSKKEIAIYRLLGKTKNEIRLTHCINNLFISIVGIILGFFIGSLLLLLIANYYVEFLQIPKTVFSVNFKSIVLCFIITIIVVETATILATLELDKITPMEVLKKEEYQNKQTSKFINKITSFLKPFQKFSFLVYIRNKRNFILGVICISAISAMIFTSLAYVASKDKIFNEYFGKRINYDSQIFENKLINEKEIEEIKGLDYVEDAILLRYINTSIKKNKKELDVTINALDNDNNYINIYDQNNKELTIPKKGIILEQHLADELEVKKNDIVTIQNKSFKVVDISFQPFGRINYMSKEDAKDLESSFDSIVLKMDNKYQNQLVEKVSNDKDYIYTVNYKNLKDYNKKEFDSYNIAPIVIIIFAILIGFIIVLNLNEYNLVEQKRNLAVFRSLGFHTKEISRNLSIQSIIPWILSLVFGLPIGIALSKYVLKAASSPRREYIYASGLKEVIITFILIGLFIGIGHFLSMRKIKYINITEEIKERD